MYKMVINAYLLKAYFFLVFTFLLVDILITIQPLPERYSYNFAKPMRTMIWLVLFQFIAGAMNAQYKDYPKLEKLFLAEKYNKCISKAGKYAKKNRKELIPQVYIMKSWLKISEDYNHKAYKRAINKAITAARRIRRKDVDDVLYDKYTDDFIDLQLKAFEKADADVADGKCNKAIRIYNKLNEIFDDAASAYKKSVCLLENDFKKKEGFILLRNTMLRLYSLYKKGEYYATLPAGFARLSKEYLARRYFVNAEGTLKRGVEVFPNDTSLRNEAVRQATLQYNALVTSDYEKDLLKLHTKLLWVNSNFKNYPPAEAMLKETDRRIILQYIKFEYTTTDKVMGFIQQIQKQNPQQNTHDSISEYLISLYNHKDIRRIYGALNNLTNTLISFNKTPATKANLPIAKYVFNFILNKGNYEVAAHFIKQAKKLYPKDRKMLKAMQQSLENILIELLTDIEKDEVAIDLAKKFTSIAPKNKKLTQLEQQLYIDVLNQHSSDSNYSAFFTIANRGLARFPTNAAIKKLKKEMVVKDFKQNYIPNLITNYKEMKVITHTPTCTHGKVAPAANTKFINLLNYLRRQAGVYDSCFLDGELNEMAQQASLMMKIRNTISHSPDSTWKCYTWKGKKAAGSSNLSFGHAGTDALLGQMEDNGLGNGSVGHRRWILNPLNKVFGHGSTSNTMTLYVFGKYFKNDPIKNQNPDWDDTQFISWPPKDYAPLTLVPKRWSFSLENADFGKAKISVTKKGKRVKIRPEKVSNGYALNTCVWQMKTPIKAGDVYKIIIKNVGVLNQSKPKTFTYTIEVLDL